MVPTSVISHTMVISGAKISTQLGNRCSNFDGPLVSVLGMVVWPLWIGSNSTGKSIYKSMLSVICDWVIWMKWFNTFITYELLFCYSSQVPGWSCRECLSSFFLWGYMWVEYIRSVSRTIPLWYIFHIAVWLLHYLVNWLIVICCVAFF